MRADTDQHDGKLDLVPMIDCIMLLLLFFILTTRFISEEKTIASLLPAKGQAQTVVAAPVPPQDANICIYPAGFERGLQPSQYAAKLRELGSEPTRAWLRIGTAEPLEIDLAQLRGRASPEVAQQVATVHAYIAEQLARFEADGGTAARDQQRPITIHCFSGMSWAYALVAYDACRAYEATHGAGTIAARDLDQAREVDFAPPRLRDSSPHGLGDELFEIVQLR